MAADVTALFTIIALALFTLTSIIAGYLLLNTAVTSVARESTYYTYTRLCDTIGNSISSSSASTTNARLSPKYVLFFAKFSDETEIFFDEFDGQRLNDIAVNMEDLSFFNDIRLSSSGNSYSNRDFTSREFLKECIDETCFCIGEVNSALILEQEYFDANACVNICWGDDVEAYDSCLTNNIAQYTTPRELMEHCNQIVSEIETAEDCSECVEFISGGQLSVANGNGYDIMVINSDLNNNNDINSQLLEDFSEATKYSFLSNVIECRPISEMAINAGRAGYCSDSSILVTSDFNDLNIYSNVAYSYEENEGILAMISSTQSIGNDYTGYTLSDNTINFNLFTFEYYQNNQINPQICQVYPSFINAEIVE